MTSAQKIDTSATSSCQLACRSRMAAEKNGVSSMAVAPCSRGTKLRALSVGGLSVAVDILYLFLTLDVRSACSPKDSGTDPGCSSRRAADGTPFPPESQPALVRRSIAARRFRHVRFQSIREPSPPAPG